GNAHDQAELEGPDVDELTARDDERTEWNENERREVGGGADSGRREAAHGAAGEAEPEDRAEEDPDPDQGETDQLGVVVRPCTAAPPGRAFLDPAGRLR